MSRVSHTGARRAKFHAVVVSSLFDVAGLLLPRRIADEEIGDAAEIIVLLVEQQRPNWQIYLKVASTIFWAFFNAFRNRGRSATAKSPKVKELNA